MFLLNIWLNNIVPEHTVAFVRLALAASMVQVISNPMITAMLATGNIKKYQIIVGGIGMLVLPIAWIFFHLGFPPEIAYITIIFVFICQLLCRLLLIRSMIGLSIKRFVNEVILKIATVSVAAISLPMLLCFCMEDGWKRFLLIGFVSVISSGLSIFFIGLEANERNFFLKIFQKIKIWH